MKYSPPEDQSAESINSPDFNKPWSSLRLLAKFALFIVVPYFLVLGLLHIFPVNFLPVRAEVLLGKWVTPKAFVNKAATAEMAAILRKIAPPRPRLPLQVKVTENGSFNALTFPGGTIHFHMGAYELLKKESERAMILGHEIAHSELGHIGRRVTSGLVLMIPHMVLRTVGLDLFDFSESLAKNAFSRNDEMDADAYAARLVHSHYGSLESGIRAFEIMEVAVEDQAKGAATEYQSTHPLTKSRIRKLKEMKFAPSD